MPEDFAPHASRRVPCLPCVSDFLRCLPVSLMVVAGLAAGSSAQALGLGPGVMQSGLGQDLRLRITLNAAADDDVGCVSLKGRDDLPLPGGLRYQVLSDAGGKFIEVTSTQIVNDPAVAIIVTAGCTAALSREYVVFLDPVPLAAVDAGRIAGTVAAASGNSVQGADGPGRVPGQATADPGASGQPAADGVPGRRARHSAANALRSLNRRADGPNAPPAVAGPAGGSEASSPSAGAAAPASAGPRRVARPAVPRKPSTPTPAVVLAPAVPESGSADRLHLSRATDSPDLRVATDLAIGADSVPPDAEHLAALKAEQVRLMALLNGQDPNAIATPREVELQTRVKELSAGMTGLREQVERAAERDRVLEASRISSWIVWGLAAVALLAIGLAVWLAARYRTLQRLNADQPWWEQSQLATGLPVVSPSDEQPAPSRSSVSVLTPEQEDNTISVYSAEMARPTKSAAPIRTTARAPERTVPTAGPASIARPEAPHEKPHSAPAAPVTSPRKPEPAVPFGAVSTAIGSLDEKVEATELTRSVIDFNLDLPDFIADTPAGAAPVPASDRVVQRPAAGAALTGAPLLSRAPTPLKAGASAGTAGTPAAPAAPFKLDALDFELPRPDEPSPAPMVPLGPDTILRLDESPVPMAEHGGAAGDGDQASLQFKLLRFASAVEQASELQRAGEPANAIAVLRLYVLRDESIPTLMWLMLFELYRQVNKKPVYEALADHFHRRYKRHMVGWSEAISDKTPQLGLAELPDVEQRLMALWGRQAGLELLRELSCDRDQPDDIVFNVALQRDLLDKAKTFPFEDSV